MARILHIEDDAANRALVRKLLKSAGHEVLEAEDGVAGVRLACAAHPDLVLVDLNIPGLDGYEVTLRLRAEPSLAGVPIVAITAEGDRDTSLAVGCDGFVQKPIDARRFAALLGRYLGAAPEARAADPTADRLRQQGQRIVSHLEAKIAELSSAHDRLLDLDRAKNAFYRTMSHELATPMTPIVGYLDMLAREQLGPLAPAQRTALVATQACVRRLRALLDDLLDVTALEGGTLALEARAYDLGEVLARATTLAEGALRDADARLTCDRPEGPLPGVGDAPRLARAVAHLLSNAAKFGPRGGRVARRARAAGDDWEVRVADEGPGVDAERAEHLFEPFIQADGSPTRAHGGVGVGLSIARRVVEGHGGSVRVERGAEGASGEPPLGGAAFVLVFPRQARADAPGRAP